MGVPKLTEVFLLEEDMQEYEFDVGLNVPDTKKYCEEIMKRFPGSKAKIEAEVGPAGGNPMISVLVRKADQQKFEDFMKDDGGFVDIEMNRVD